MTHETRKIIGIMSLAFSIVFFGLGMYFPILSTHTKVVFKFGYDEVNILKSVKMFFESKDYFLATIILIFTFILPIAEYAGLIIRISKDNAPKKLQNFDKWNMLDVFLVALLLLNFKMQSNIIVMELKIGTTFIALAVMFRVLTVVLITKKDKI